MPRSSRATTPRGRQEIARLVPIEAGRRRRPAVGTVTSAPVRVAAGAFDAMTDAELADWDL